MRNLSGKIAWVTGAGGGIGEASAMALAASGAHVALSGRRAEELERVLAQIKVAGGEAEIAPLDVVDAEPAQAIADDLTKRRGDTYYVIPPQAALARGPWQDAAGR